MRENPLIAADLVRQGLRLAAEQRHTQRYPWKWPTALARCISNVPDACPSHTPVPDSEWGEVWGKAVQAVVAYYQVERTPMQRQDQSASKAIPS